MATITSVAPFYETRQGGLVTITGTGFGASQSTGTVTVGGKALTNITWGATSITGKLASDCPYGAQDAVVTPAGGSAVTAQKAVFCYDSTSAKDRTLLAEGLVGEVFLYTAAGVGGAVGFTSDALDLVFRSSKVTFDVNDRHDVPLEKVYSAIDGCRVTFSQIVGSLLANVLGGTYDDTAKTLSLVGGAERAELSLLVVEAGGIVHYFPSVKADGDVTLSLNKAQKKLPVDFSAYSLNLPSALKYQCKFPS